MTTNEAHTNADKPKRNEWKVLLVLVLALLLLEALVRCFAGSLSLDLHNILETPKTATRIASAPKDVRTVLVVGNSLARKGVDLALLSQNTAWSGFTIEPEIFAPDGSSVVQWDWGMKRYFANTDSHPDIILLFTGRVHLLDLQTSPETLGAYYVGIPDLIEALKSMPGSEDALCLFLGRTSHLLANRDRVRTRIGYSYLPGFEAVWPALTAANEAEPEATGGQSPDASTASLARLIATTKEMGSELHVFSVPMPDAYEMPLPVLQLLEKTNTPFQDFSALPGITPDRFPDHYHLDETGAKIFTRAILTSLQRSPSGNIQPRTPDP